MVPLEGGPAQQLAALQQRVAWLRRPPASNNASHGKQQARHSSGQEGREDKRSSESAGDKRQARGSKRSRRRAPGGKGAAGAAQPQHWQDDEAVEVELAIVDALCRQQQDTSKQAKQQGEGRSSRATQQELQQAKELQQSGAQEQEAAEPAAARQAKPTIVGTTAALPDDAKAMASQDASKPGSDAASTAGAAHPPEPASQPKPCTPAPNETPGADAALAPAAPPSQPPPPTAPPATFAAAVHAMPGPQHQLLKEALLRLLVDRPAFCAQLDARSPGLL
jgi:hypothetical protein